MKKVIVRWPVLLLAVGIALILFYIAQNVLDSPVAQLDVVTATVAVTATDPPSTATAVSPSRTPLPPSRTAVPLLPTPTHTPQPEVEPQPTDTAVSPTETPTSTAVCSLAFCGPRFGATGRIRIISAAFSAGLPFGNYFNWELETDPLLIGEATFWQMVRVNEDGIRHDWEKVAQAVEMNPGSIWIVGNEPDIMWQDNTTPEQYARSYHDVYTYIKERDPTARIAVGGVGQATPLRLKYLDIVLQTYTESYGESMPVDIWTIHNFILREERDSWGVGIPVGLTQESGLPLDQGILYEIEDHDDMALFKQNLIDFRQWMADRGYRDRPLAVTEFGILMPADFGFPPEVVAEFMTATFDFLVQATDETIGYPADENRLVQWSFWYSVYDGAEFPTGNLYDPDSDVLTTLGTTYADYINGN